MIVVIGGGVSGLASALALQARGRDVCVIERHPRVGLETSTHNSGVIHAGLYYPAGSLKAQLCIDGRDRLYAFCKAASVPHVRCGKLLVAQAHEEAELSLVQRAATANGAHVEAVDRAFVRAREPHIRAAFALWSPDTGWLEAEAYLRALEARLQSLGGVVLVGTSVVAIESNGDAGLVVITPHERIEAELVVNAAGLFADDVSRMAGGEGFTIHACRGEYAELAPSARSLVNGLVYPIPHAAGHSLGVHFTKTLDGAVWIGPTARYQDDKTDYERNREPIEAFLEPTRALLPAVTLADLRLGGSGIRPKLAPPHERFADFMIRRDTRQPFLVQAAGIESPGLTASLAVGELVARIALGDA